MTNEAIDAIKQGYTFDEPAIELGVLLADGEPRTDVGVRIPLSMLNRHGLVAGATGTGKTKTLQLLAEQISNAGVPVFAADIKGDLSGLSKPGVPNDKLLARIRAKVPNVTLRSRRRRSATSTRSGDRARGCRCARPSAASDPPS